MNETEYSLIEEMLPLLVTDGKGNFTLEQIEAANKFKKFIDHLPGGFLIYRADGDEEIIYANKALIHMFECHNIQEFLEFTGNSFKGMIYSEDREEVLKSITQQINEGGENLDYVEYRILTKNGNLRYAEDYGHFIKTKVGDMYYVFITDSTEKIAKRQQEHMQRLEVIEGLSVNYDSILYIDLDTDSVMPYRLSQRLAMQFDGKMQSRKFSEISESFVNYWVHPDDRSRISTVLSPDYIRRMLNGNSSYYANFRCVQGTDIRYLQLRIVDVKCNGPVSQVVLGSRNIEEELKQEMQQKTLLENALKDSKQAYIAKNAFLSNISHDMRTPLNALFGYLELAKKHIDNKETLEKHLTSVNEAGKQLMDLVNKVLEISYLESNDFQLAEDLCNLEGLASEVYDEVVPIANKKKIELNVEAHKVEHPVVFTDKSQLKQILLNLVTNAIKYTGTGGKVHLLVEEKRSASSEFASFRFVVKDTGIGIAKESLEKIFEPFEREHNYTQSGVFGSGLGLTIVKQILDSMGGTITAESEVGVGSTFTVELSFKLSENDDASSNLDEVEEFIKGKKILVVEDNEINMEIETELLEDLGLIVEPAENGLIAVEKMKIAQPYEYLFVLMDIQMPVMDGWQATEGIRSLDNPALSEIPIIALSANAFESDKRLSAKNGMNAHLNKPIDLTALLKAIKKTVMKK